MSKRTGTNSASSSDSDLPLLGKSVTPASSRPIRADAVRNREKVLDAAERLFARAGVDGISMQAVAKEAGVGVGTLYRGFGDKAGIAMALLGERERRFQELMLSGPPPLGPGAAPVDRLVAFTQGYLELVAERLELVMLSQNSAVGARFRSGAHALWRAHCRYLFELSGVAEPGTRADMLLASLSAEMVAHWIIDTDRALDELSIELAGIVRSLALTAPGSAGG